MPRLEEARPFILFKQQGIRFRILLALEGLRTILQARARISGEGSRPSRTRKLLSCTPSKRGQSPMGQGGYKLGSASADEGVEVGIKGRSWPVFLDFFLLLDYIFSVHPRSQSRLRAETRLDLASYTSPCLLLSLTLHTDKYFTTSFLH